MGSVNGYHKSHKWIKIMGQLTVILGMNGRNIFINCKMGKKERLFQCIRPLGKYQAKIWPKPVFMRPVVNEGIPVCDRDSELGKEMKHSKGEQAIMFTGRNKDNVSLHILF